MKALVITIVLVAAFAGTMSGCDTTMEMDNTAAHSPVDTWLARVYADDAMRNAIIAQHTLYSCHFIANSAELNELGRHDLAILADHFRKYPGNLNLRRGDETAKLYAQRVNVVVKTLKEAGVDAKQVAMGDALPGGEGMSSERVVSILSEQPASGSETTTTYEDSSAPQE